MESINRKNFIKKICLTGTCLCGFNAMGIAKNNGMHETEHQRDDKNKCLSHEWLAILLNNISDQMDENEMRALLKGCSAAHFNNLGMDEKLAQYKYNLKEFISFLESEWGWIVTFNKEENVIVVNENKPHCVCPLINRSNKTGLTSLCYCSEGFAERMFSFVIDRQISATVVSSIQRGDKNCIYRIVL
jgi:predicted hydrocarbon binding protein